MPGQGFDKAFVMNMTLSFVDPVRIVQLEYDKAQVESKICKQKCFLKWGTFRLSRSVSYAQAMAIEAAAAAIANGGAFSTAPSPSPAPTAWEKGHHEGCHGCLV